MQTHPSCGTKEYSQTEELDPIFSIHAQVAVDHLNMLVSLVEEMTCKWERQLEDVGEGRWNDDMLAKEGTEGERDGGPAAVGAFTGETRMVSRRRCYTLCDVVGLFCI